MGAPVLAQSLPHHPRLDPEITADRLRGDMIARYGERLGEGGFARLMKTGAVFVNADHRHANNETFVGHATLSTGADPAPHGMVANLRCDAKTGQQAHNVQDPDYPLIFAGPGIRTKTAVGRVETVDIAPPLAAYPGIKPPGVAVGVPLPEVFG
ncbi:alkaline phosphatase family protein [Jhaorihella thermophila]|uniref:Type I phosphodiesterase / nucleotide pyrophosphatase n=1 Tax=Jhaorihella thermophila TaxID=488547 RepID=A0A1H5VSS4_9RHOB|nr:alkaline phosphatase family protein [Jhaorihella thermophila]SEF90270.1 Type I phosphodiesterase / nucleotide pyrophosphatase [Jhaorihella thermophila]